MTRSGIEPRSSGRLMNTLPISQWLLFFLTKSLKLSSDEPVHYSVIAGTVNRLRFKQQTKQSLVNSKNIF